MWTALLLVGAASAAQIPLDPAAVPTAACHTKSPDFDQCLLAAFRENLPKLSKFGVKQLDFPPIDPLYVPQILITFNGSEIQAKSSIKNSFTHGLRNIQILDVRTNLQDSENQVMEGEFFLPKVVIEGTYKTDGRLGNFPVNGKGVFNITMTNVTSSVKVEGHLVTLKEQQHLKVHKVSMRPEVGNMKIYASNLINDNEELSLLALNVVNQFWRLFYEEMLPYAEQGFDEILRGVINKYTLKVAYDQMWTVD